MSGQSDITRVGQLILARLLAAGEKGATWSALKKDLEPLVGHRWAGGELERQLRKEAQELEAASLVVWIRKGKTEKGMLTPAGRRRTLDALGVDQLPSKANWGNVKKTFVVAQALGLRSPKGDAAKSFGSDDGFKAVLLNRTFELGLGESPTFAKAMDALAWKLLGFPSGKKFDVQGIKAALIRRELGDPRTSDAKPDAKKEVAKLLAKRIGARQSGKDELRLAAIRHWVDEEEEEAEAAAAPPTPPALEPITSPAYELDGQTFAARVIEAARSSPSGRFGGNKVFIAHVWDALRHDPRFAPMGLDGFKQRLAAANNAGLLSLSRADLVEAMPQDDVRLSEVAYETATFHFVRI